MHTETSMYHHTQHTPLVLTHKHNTGKAGSWRTLGPYTPTLTPIPEAGQERLPIVISACWDEGCGWELSGGRLSGLGGPVNP